MPVRLQSGGARSRSGLARWCVVLVVAGLLLGSGTLLFLRWVGVPDLLKNQVQALLRERGMSADYGRMRLVGFKLVIDRLGIKRVTPGAGPQVVIDQAEVPLVREALRRGRVEPAGIVLSRCRVLWRFGAPGLSPQPEVELGDFAAQVRFLPGDRVEVTRLRGRLFNATVHGSIVLTNASALSRWTLLKSEDKQPSAWQTVVERWLREMQRLHLPDGSSLSFGLQVDGRDPSSLTANLHLDSPFAAWAYGAMQDAKISVQAHRFEVQSNTTRIDLSVESGRLTLDSFGALSGFQLAAQWTGSITNLDAGAFAWQARIAKLQLQPVTSEDIQLSGTSRLADPEGKNWRTELSARASAVRGPWGESFKCDAGVELDHGLTISDPWQAHWRFATGPVHSRWGDVALTRSSGTLAPQNSWAEWQAVDTAWGLWGKLAPFHLQWECYLQDLVSSGLQARSVSSSGDWSAPNLVVQHLRAELYQGGLQTSASLDVASRELRSESALTFDVRELSPLLTDPAQRWLSQFGWTVPPHVSARTRLILPAWTEPQPQWRKDVLPTIQLEGEFTGTEGTFRGVPIAFARSRFALTNFVWLLPDLYVRRPDGEAALHYTGDMRSREYRWKVNARLDPRAVRPLLPHKTAQRVLDEFQFTQPPAVQGEVFGRWEDQQSIAFRGHVAATNFLFRGERCSRLESTLRFTNSILHFADLRIRHDEQQIQAPAGWFDLIEQVVYVTNTVSTMDPDLVTKVIGPKVRAAVRPYWFETPPTVHVNGRLPTTRVQDADVHFQVAGDRFSYWRFHVPSVTGDVRWRGDLLSITNVHAAFYGGQLVWAGEFDFSVPVGAQLQFQARVRRADFHQLMVDLVQKTNQVEGALDADIGITSANSDDWRSWQGLGDVRLRNGFLWDIPIFGIFSPALNAIVPGLGKSPVSAGHATFDLVDSVVRTSDLELKSPALRLRYNGTVDLQGKVNARMRADILRDAWGVGRALSLALWPISKAFEYKMNGTVYHPKSEPVYIPKALLWPLQPFRTLKKLFLRKPLSTSSPSMDPPLPWHED